MIGHVWLDPDYYPTRSKKRATQDDDSIVRKKPRAAGGSVSSISTGSTGHSRRACVSESALNPMNGALKCRLNHTILHLPVKPDMSPKQAYCQLHYWCKTKRKYFNTAYCPNSNVVHCVNTYYEVFHSEWIFTL